MTLRADLFLHDWIYKVLIKLLMIARVHDNFCGRVGISLSGPMTCNYTIGIFSVEQLVERERDFMTGSGGLVHIVAFALP